MQKVISEWDQEIFFSSPERMSMSSVRSRQNPDLYRAIYSSVCHKQGMHRVTTIEKLERFGLVQPLVIHGHICSLSYGL